VSLPYQNDLFLEFLYGVQYEGYHEHYVHAKNDPMNHVLYAYDLVRGDYESHGFHYDVVRGDHGSKVYPHVDEGVHVECDHDDGHDDDDDHHQPDDVEDARLLQFDYLYGLLNAGG